MKAGICTAALSAALGLGFASAPAGAAVETVFNWSVAPSHCQAFTPGVTNTIRNRVSGAENIGAAMAVACSFENIATGQGGLNKSVTMFFYNNTAAPMTIDCTNLNGYFGSVVSTINKTVVVNPGTSGYIAFSAADTPSTTDTNLGSFYSGVNCTLPTGAIMTATQATWEDDFA